jgi:hypothetical protein
MTNSSFAVCNCPLTPRPVHLLEATADTEVAAVDLEGDDPAEGEAVDHFLDEQDCFRRLRYFPASPGLFTPTMSSTPLPSLNVSLLSAGADLEELQIELLSPSAKPNRPTEEKNDDDEPPTPYQLPPEPGDPCNDSLEEFQHPILDEVHEPDIIVISDDGSDVEPGDVGAELEPGVTLPNGVPPVPGVQGVTHPVAVVTVDNATETDHGDIRHTRPPVQGLSYIRLGEYMVDWPEVPAGQLVCRLSSACNPALDAAETMRLRKIVNVAVAAQMAIIRRMGQLANTMDGQERSAALLQLYMELGHRADHMDLSELDDE